MTKWQFVYMRDLEQMDNIHQGMLDPSRIVPKPDLIRQQCADNGWVRVGRVAKSYGKPVVFLTTRGKKAIKRMLQKQKQVASS